MFTKILIANRGVHRVIATARKMGIATVPEADRDARHVLLADEAVHQAGARESYLVA